jgi:hypothetical protein
MEVAFLPWLFDNRDAWEKTIKDSRYKYDLTMDNFMAIYQEYRSGSKTVSAEEAEAIAAQAFAPSPDPTPEPSPSSSSGGNAADMEMGQILSQDEIDALFG